MQVFCIKKAGIPSEYLPFRSKTNLDRAFWEPELQLVGGCFWVA